MGKVIFFDSFNSIEYSTEFPCLEELHEHKNIRTRSGINFFMIIMFIVKILQR